MPIYTKRGDKGKTNLFTEKGKKEIRIYKDSERVEAIGALDEFNSYLGVALSFCQDRETRDFIIEIQKNIFSINSILAGAKLRFGKSKTSTLEKKIDEIDKKVPKLSNFLLPSGSQFAAHLMYARSMIRRAERRLVHLNKTEDVKAEIVMYVNRLSDMVFMLFREANFKSGSDEVLWKQSK